MHIKFRVQIDIVHYVRFLTQKTASEKMKGLGAEKVVFAMKIINLNAKMSIEEIKVAFVFEIDGNSIHMTMTLMN